MMIMTGVTVPNGSHTDSLEQRPASTLEALIVVIIVIIVIIVISVIIVIIVIIIFIIIEIISTTIIIIIMIYHQQLAPTVETSLILWSVIMVMTMVVVFSFASEVPHNHQLIEHQCNFCSLSGNFDGLDSTYDVDSNVVNAEDDSLLRGFGGWGAGGRTGW